MKSIPNTSLSPE